jgi:uncharacterized protein (TIGR02996 family)
MSTEDDLLAGIAAHPGEDDRWLILADWLEDQQDPRAELARLRYLLHAEPDHPDRAARIARQFALLDSGLAPVAPTITTASGMAFALVQAGSFWMGSSPSEDDRGDDETRHRVTLTRPFGLGVYPVTVAEFRRFVLATNHVTDAERNGGGFGLLRGGWRQDAAFSWRAPGFDQESKQPVVCVSWNDAQAMIAWLNAQEKETGLVYALPTEAQWEYACRAGTETARFWGDSEERIRTYAWFTGNANQRTRPVQTKKPNPWGLYHTIGLVWEWCADCPRAFTGDAVVDPVGANTNEAPQHPVRGGSWGNTPDLCRAAYRVSYGRQTAWSAYGFRLAMALPA